MSSVLEPGILGKLIKRLRALVPDVLIATALMFLLSSAPAILGWLGLNQDSRGLLVRSEWMHYSLNEFGVRDQGVLILQLLNNTDQPISLGDGEVPFRIELSNVESILRSATIPQRDTGMTSARMLSEMGAIEILNWLIEPSDSLEIMLMVAPTIEGLVEVSAAGPGSPTDDWEVVVLGSEDRFGNGFGLVPSIWLALSMSTFILLIAIALLYRRVAVRFSLDTVDSSSSPRDGEGKV